MRKVHVFGQEWSYRIRQGSAVLVDPSGRKFVVDLATLTGRSWDAIERGRRKITSDGMILPSDVKSYIEWSLREPQGTP